MSWLRGVRERREADRKATQKSRELLANMVKTEPAATEQHFEALQELRRAEEQAKRLKAMDTQNHYSESLTHAFRGKPA